MFPVDTDPRNFRRVVYKARSRRDSHKPGRLDPATLGDGNNMGRRSARKTAHEADASLAKAGSSSRNSICQRTVRNDRAHKVNFASEAELHPFICSWEPKFVGCICARTTRTFPKGERVISPQGLAEWLSTCAPHSGARSTFALYPLFSSSQKPCTTAPVSFGRSFSKLAELVLCSRGVDYEVFS